MTQFQIISQATRRDPFNLQRPYLNAILAFSELLHDGLISARRDRIHFHLEVR